MNKTAAEMGTITMLRVYFMDLENSVQIDPDEMEMMGSHLDEIERAKGEINQN